MPRLRARSFCWTIPLLTCPNYVQKDGDKVLSDNNFSDADKTKLDGIAEGANNYTHPSHTAAASGFYKVTVDELAT